MTKYVAEDVAWLKVGGSLLFRSWKSDRVFILNNNLTHLVLLPHNLATPVSHIGIPKYLCINCYTKRVRASTLILQHTCELLTNWKPVCLAWATLTLRIFFLSAARCAFCSWSRNGLIRCIVLWTGAQKLNSWGFWPNEMFSFVVWLVFCKG